MLRGIFLVSFLVSGVLCSASIGIECGGKPARSVFLSLGRLKAYHNSTDILLKEKVFQTAVLPSLYYRSTMLYRGYHKTPEAINRIQIMVFEYSTLALYERLIANIGRQLELEFPGFGLWFFHSVVNRSVSRFDWKAGAGSMLPSIPDLIAITQTMRNRATPKAINNQLYLVISESLRHFQRIVEDDLCWRRAVVSAMAARLKHGRLSVFNIYNLFELSPEPSLQLSTPSSSSAELEPVVRQNAIVMIKKLQMHSEQNAVIPVFVGDMSTPYTETDLPWENVVKENNILVAGALIVPRAIGVKLSYDIDRFLDVTQQEIKNE